VQEQILEQNPSSEVRVYVIWFAMVPLDYRWRWDDEVMTDPRVIHLWDEKKLAGQWFAEHVEDYQGIVWDTYYLYGPEARWDRTPTPLISSGYTVLAKREELQRSLVPLLKD
jgi:hypothetical protein